VEVCLALAVAAFAFVGIFALLPAGMSAFRASINTSTSAQIAQKVLNEAQQTDFALLVNGAAATSYNELAKLRYFDEEGNELADSQASQSIYHVHVVVQYAPKLSDSSGNSSVVMDELACVVVQVAANPGQQALTKDDECLLWTSTSVPIWSYASLVAHQQ